MKQKTKELLDIVRDVVDDRLDSMKEPFDWADVAKEIEEKFILFDITGGTFDKESPQAMDERKLGH